MRKGVRGKGQACSVLDTLLNIHATCVSGVLAVCQTPREELGMQQLSTGQLSPLPTFQQEISVTQIITQLNYIKCATQINKFPLCSSGSYSNILG